MSIKRNALPSDVLEDLRALEVALSRWRLAKGDDPLPLEPQAWRDTVAARLSELDYAGREPGEPYGASASWWYSGRLQEIGFIFETQAQLNLPSRSRGWSLGNAAPYVFGGMIGHWPHRKRAV